MHNFSRSFHLIQFLMPTLFTNLGIVTKAKTFASDKVVSELKLGL
jgi:hypothetical protein